MDLNLFASNIKSALKTNSPTILTAIGVSGAISTAYLTGQASWRASRRISEGPPIENKSKREIFEEVWDLYVPAAISGIVTIGCILGANHVSSKRATAAYSILALSEKTLDEYRIKVVEQLGERKEKEMHDQVIQERISENPPKQIIIAGNGDVLCCELLTGRYFTSNMEALRTAQNDINSKLLRENYVTINEFYYILGIPQTSNSGVMGWESDKLLELEFTTAMSDDKRPCLAFEYNYTKVL